MIALDNISAVIYSYFMLIYIIYQHKITVKLYSEFSTLITCNIYQGQHNSQCRIKFVFDLYNRFRTTSIRNGWWLVSKYNCLVNNTSVINTLTDVRAPTKYTQLETFKIFIVKTSNQGKNIFKISEGVEKPKTRILVNSFRPRTLSIQF